MNIRLTVSQKKEMEDLISFLAFALLVRSTELTESARIYIGSFCADLEERGILPKNSADQLFDYMVEKAKEKNRL